MSSARDRSESELRQSSADLEEYVDRRIKITLRRQAERALARQLAQLQGAEPLPLRTFCMVLVVIVAVLLALAFGVPYLWRMVSA